MKITKVLSLCLIALIAGLSSCNKNDDNGLCTIQGYFTVQSLSNGTAKAYFDGGGVINITENADVLISENYERGALNISYYMDDVQSTESEIVVKKAKLLGAQKTKVLKPISKEDAEEKGVFDPEKRGKFVKVLELWASNGYLNVGATYQVLVNGEKYIEPTVYLVYDDSKVEDNVLNLKAYYNPNKTEQTTKATQTNLMYSFRINDLSGLVGGDDDVIKVNITFDGLEKVQVLNMRRKDFSRPFTTL